MAKAKGRSPTLDASMSPAVTPEAGTESTSALADQPPLTVNEGGLSAYVDVQGKDGELRVVLCRACGISSPPLVADDETEWFKRHAAEDREEHDLRRSRR